MRGRREGLRRMLRRVARVAKVIAVNLLIILGLALPIELIFCDWFNGENIAMLNIRANTIDVGPSPLYPPETKITYTRDKYGFRAGAGDASRVDVLAIGGSTTNERFVDDADVWTTRVQRLLAGQGCDLTIANAGVDGYSTIAHIASFDQWFNRIPGLRPRFALVYLGINDAV